MESCFPIQWFTPITETEDGGSSGANLIPGYFPAAIPMPIAKTPTKAAIEMPA